MRDRLIEIFKNTNYKPFEQCNIKANLVNQFSDYALNCIVDKILANGVIVPPCKVGDTVWYITGIHGTLIKSAMVEEIIVDKNGVSGLVVNSENIKFENSIEQFYMTKKEAQQVLKGGAQE